jgi:hypothetical protein
MFIYLTLLLVILFLTIYINVFYIKKTCPPSEIIYKYLPEDELKDQFKLNDPNTK